MGEDKGQSTFSKGGCRQRGGEQGTSQVYRAQGCQVPKWQRRGRTAGARRGPRGSAGRPCPGAKQTMGFQVIGAPGSRAPRHVRRAARPPTSRRLWSPRAPSLSANSSRDDNHGACSGTEVVGAALSRCLPQSLQAPIARREPHVSDSLAPGLCRRAGIRLGIRTALAVARERGRALCYLPFLAMTCTQFTSR